MADKNSAASIAENLALVRACLNGDEQAWNSFIARYRPTLYSAALTITRDNDLARELSDSLWAELFGTRIGQDGRRVSKLASYAGRGSLDGWLRALLAQEYVNRHRKDRRLVTLDDNRQQDIGIASEGAEVASADSRLSVALGRAIAELQGEEQLILASHYLDGRNLAEIGRMLNLHESTVSRRLKKSVRFLRKRTIHYLRKDGMSMSQAAELIAADVRQISIELRDQLLPVKDAL